MPSRPTLPTPLPPHAAVEVLAAFEESDPDACALLLPWQEGLTPGQLEIRLRQRRPETPAPARAELASRAVALLELVAAEIARPVPEDSAATSSPPVTSAERARRHGLLIAEMTRHPGTKAEAARRYLEAELGVTVPKGTFYGGYWKPVLAQLPVEIRQLQQEMRARRPGRRRLHLSQQQRTKVRHLAAVVKRDHPGWHAGQIMDEVRRITGHEFHDPTAFRRNYLDRVDPAAWVEPAPEPVSAALVDVGRDDLAAPYTSPEYGGAPAVTEPAGTKFVHSGGLHALLAAAEPQRPAELIPSPDGLAQVRLNLRSMKWSESHRLMSSIHAAMADLMAEAGG